MYFVQGQSLYWKETQRTQGTKPYKIWGRVTQGEVLSARKVNCTNSQGTLNNPMDRCLYLLAFSRLCYRNKHAQNLTKI